MLQTFSQRAPEALPQLLQALQRSFAAKAAGGKSSSGGGSSNSSSSAGGSVVVKKDWKAVKLPETTASAIPETTLPGQAFVGDLRSTSGLGMGDGKNTHTSKWLTVRSIDYAAVLLAVSRMSGHSVISGCSRAVETAAPHYLPSSLHPSTL